MVIDSRNILIPTNFIIGDYSQDTRNTKILWKAKNWDIMPRITLSDANYYNSLPSDIKDFIEKKWQCRKNYHFNGNLIRLDGVNKKNNELQCSFVDYKAFHATSGVDFFNCCMGKTTYIANPLTVSPIIVTRDDKIIIGSRKNTQIMQFPGGMLDYYKDRKNDEIDLTFCAIREVNEELCPINLYDFKFLGLSINLKQIYSTVYLTCKTDLTFNEVIKLRIKYEYQIPDSYEMPRIECIKIAKKDLMRNIAKHEVFAATALVGLKLFDRFHFGEE